jgi:hypothetical protein
MARIRRLAAVVGAAALAGSLVGGPARADSPEVFQGSAAGTALDLSILGKQVTLGASAAKADSTGKAEAKGAGILSSTDKTVDDTLGLKSTQKVASASGTAITTDDKAKSCGKGIDLLEAVSLGLACSAAKATSGPAPSATGEGSVVEAGVDASAVIDSIIETVETVTAVPVDVKEELNAIGGTVAGLLDPVCEATQDTNTVVCDAQTTIKDLVTSVLKTKTLEVGVGTTTSSVDTTASSVTSKAAASGAVVKLLPLPQVNGLPSTEPVATITVGEATASASYDRAAGTATGKADPAIVRIKFNTVLTKSLADQLGDLPVLGRLDDIVLNPNDLLDVQALLDEELDGGVPTLIESCEGGRAICILKGTPLESRIYLATSKVTTNPDGSVVATADAVRMELATGVKFDELLDTVNGAAAAANLDLKGPGVRLALAGVEAGVGGRPAQVTPPNDTPTLTPEQSRTLPPAELPRTGGTPLIPLIGATALALAVIGRRVAAKAVR